MDAVEKFADFLNCPVKTDLIRAQVECAQIGARAKTGFRQTMDDQNRCLIFERLVRFDKFFQLGKCPIADLIAWLAVQSELDRAIDQFPRERLTLINSHRTNSSVSVFFTLMLSWPHTTLRILFENVRQWHRDAACPWLSACRFQSSAALR